VLKNADFPENIFEESSKSEKLPGPKAPFRDSHWFVRRGLLPPSKFWHAKPKPLL